MTYRGSSPLARGTRHYRRSSIYGSRFIPAGAGNTTYPARAVPRPPVHPRWRGEHIQWPASNAPPVGSSPLARGTLGRALQVARGDRFIPAGAGNTSTARTTRGTRTVHPRWRGEHRANGLYKLLRGGSSPLARGTHNAVGVDEVMQRFIPAGAGNTVTYIGVSRVVSVHPRWRGEHHVDEVVGEDVGGSSPLARGTLIPRLHVPAAQRFIPAGAGNTS